MHSLKGHHLLVHPHSKVLLKTHLSVKYKEKPHLFQTLTACCPPQRLGTLQPRNSAKIKTHLAEVRQGISILVTGMIQLHS